MTYAPPQSSEMSEYAERARRSQIRIATPHGDILFALFPDDAPLHCAAFMKLADAGFYDGLTFTGSSRVSSCRAATPRATEPEGRDII